MDLDKFVPKVTDSQNCSHWCNPALLWDLLIAFYFKYQPKTSEFKVEYLGFLDVCIMILNQISVKNCFFMIQIKRECGNIVSYL